MARSPLSSPQTTTLNSKCHTRLTNVWGRGPVPPPLLGPSLCKLMPEGLWLALSLPPPAGTGPEESDLCSPAKVIPVQPFLRLPGRKERLKRTVTHLRTVRYLFCNKREYFSSKDAARHSPDNQAWPSSRHFPSWHPVPLFPQEGTEIVQTQGQTHETLLKTKGGWQ